jgi:hypothetical protein
MITYLSARSLRHGATQQDDHLGMRGAEPLQPRHLVRPVRYQLQRGPVAGHHCIACQCARIFLVNASGVSPVSTSPALLIADQRPPSALKPWQPPWAHASSSPASAVLVHLGHPAPWSAAAYIAAITPPSRLAAARDR